MNQQSTSNIGISVDKIVEMIRHLSIRDRLQLIAMIVPEIDRELPKDTDNMKDRSNRKSLYGLWKQFKVDLKTEDIDKARKEMWNNFPRADII